VDMPDGRIDMRFPYRRFPRTDTLLRNILLHSLHRTGMVRARTFSSFDSPLEFRPFQLRPPSPVTRRTANLDVAPFPAPTRDVSRESSSRSVFGDYVISDNCIQISKHRLTAKPKHSKVVWLAMQRRRTVPAVDRRIVLSVCGRF